MSVRVRRRRCSNNKSPILRIWEKQYIIIFGGDGQRGVVDVWWKQEQEFGVELLVKFGTNVELFFGCLFRWCESWRW